tara:strand:- start:299 stop:616 length:318 start_codon:yes stop_codon:yes gene_type:complete
VRVNRLKIIISLHGTDFFAEGIDMISQTEKLILQHCKQLEGTDDDERALEIAQICKFIHNGEPTRTGQIVAALLKSNEEVTYFKVKQISELLGKSEENSFKNQRF